VHLLVEVVDLVFMLSMREAGAITTVWLGLPPIVEMIQWHTYQERDPEIRAQVTPHLQPTSAHG
jgi:hypothetical protein